MNTAERLRARHRVRAAVRAYFDGADFTEVEPPVLVRAPGMEPHITAVGLRVDAGAGPQRRWLHTSPEFAMKRLLADGAERIYAVTRVFRAGEHGPHHRTEFTMIEWYRAHEGYARLMDDCEGFIRGAARAVSGGTHVSGLELAGPWERLSVAEACRRYAGVEVLDFVDPLDGPGLQRAARAAGLHVVAGPPDEDPVTAFERAFYEIMLARVEPAIGRTRPTFLFDWPAPLAALARISPADPRVAERVELYAAGLELGNGFGELTDAREQGRRFRAEQRRRRTLGRPVYPVDRSFLDALKRMPPACGMAVGLDRVLMLCTGVMDLGQLAVLE